MVTKKPQGKDRLILAVDVPSIDEQVRIHREVASNVGLVKVGLEAMTHIGTERLFAFTDMQRNEYFFDAKLFDIRETVKRTIRAYVRRNSRMVNVCYHACRPTIEGARQSLDETSQQRGIAPPALIVVTELTSNSFKDLEEVGHVAVWHEFKRGDQNAEQEAVAAIVSAQARNAQLWGADGVVCSPREARRVRQVCGDEFLIVTPGIRDPDAPPDDQARTMSPGDAVKAGADYLVVGRPFLNPQNGTTADAVARFEQQITEAEDFMRTVHYRP